MLKKGQKYIVIMIDGFGWDYYENSEMPFLKNMAKTGILKRGKAIFPTLTNANNISIVCGSFPETHGVTTNCYLNPVTGKPAFLEDPGFLKSPTLFDQAKKSGLQSALVTSKSKTIRILGQSVTEGAVVQDPDSETVRKYGTPPDVYSIEANEWIFHCGLQILDTNPEIDVLYIHTTDYPMHMWDAHDERSLYHLYRIDGLIGELQNRWPDALFLVTADHGMNPKNECLDLEKILKKAGLPVKACISPVADRLIKHHGGHGGVSYIYLNNPDNIHDTVQFLSTMKEVDFALPSAEAAVRFHLDRDRIGDIVVGASAETVFGSIQTERDELHRDYRNHGSRFEDDIPLIAWNASGIQPQDLTYNFDLTRKVFFQKF